MKEPFEIASVLLGLMTCWFTVREARNDGDVAEGLDEPGRDCLQEREGAGVCGWCAWTGSARDRGGSCRGEEVRARSGCSEGCAGRSQALWDAA